MPKAKPLLINNILTRRRTLKEYVIWKGIRARCNGVNHIGRKAYGGRGIKICKRWDDFESFYTDMGPRPTDQHSIDRIDVNGNYEPNNCRWATKKEQSNNTRLIRKVKAFGRYMPLKEWCKLFNINYVTIKNRVNSYGWPLEQALAVPSFRNYEHKTLTKNHNILLDVIIKKHVELVFGEWNDNWEPATKDTSDLWVKWNKKRKSSRIKNNPNP